MTRDVRWHALVAMATATAAPAFVQLWLTLTIQCGGVLLNTRLVIQPPWKNKIILIKIENEPNFHKIENYYYQNGNVWLFICYDVRITFVYVELKKGGKSPNIKFSFKESIRN